MTNPWIPIVSSILWLVTPAVGIKANAATSRPLPSNRQAATPAKVVAELITQSSSPSEKNCPPPILSRLTRHKIATGETLESIANQYNLIPATVLGLNPKLRRGSMPVGSEILIPPFNGIRVDVPKGSRWQDVAAAYGVRPEVLYEINGCQRQPQQVFIPGVQWSAQTSPGGDSYSGFAGYPLPSDTPVALSYGWHQNPNTGKAIFHSGIDLLTKVGTPVLAVDSGTVAFAGEQDSYGNLVVINHSGGRQTRYAHLSRLSVATGQQVKTGDKLGMVGATGRPDTDKPHLHFEVRYYSPQGWVAQDPEPNLKARPTAQR
ncbi:MAG TPA: M23 family metallopeptidase [Candidatus Sericytochromatia bacterium]|jgi:murein DD-endopeptidase MepM/ murein hydrolase activator NlpD